MNHPTEDELARFAFDGQQPSIAKHLMECSACRDTLEWIKRFDDGLRNEDVWQTSETVGAAATDSTRLPDQLRRLAREVELEDSEAEKLVDPLLRNPRAVAWQDLSSDRSYRTAGVVRRLLQAANQACEREPLEALAIADSAASVAAALDEEKYPRGVIASLRGSAAKERANALRFLGRYDEAFAALDEAERTYEDSPAALLGLTSVKYVRAGILVEREEYAAALPLVRESVRDFRRGGDIDRYMRARHLEGLIRFYQRDIREAQAIWEEVLSYGMHEDDLLWMARASRALSRCALDLGDHAKAKSHMEAARGGFARLGLGTEVTRTDWGIGMILSSTGQFGEALEVLRLVREEFTRSSLLTNAALVTLDIMDALHGLNRADEIAAEAASIIQIFTEARMLTSALTAFAYLRDARAVSRRHIDHVRQFLYRVERQPLLLFAPPPGD